jgi:hypothetical protein
MTCQIMKHEEAISSLAAERYLLGEMGDEDRSAFEAHYLNCAECLEAVTFADEFMEQARPVARRLQAQETTNVAPAREAGFVSRLLASLKGPAPAWAMVLILCMGGVISFEALQLQRQNDELAALKVPGQEIRYSLKGQSRSGGPGETIQARRNTLLRLKVEFTPGDFVAYRADIVTESGQRKYSVPLSVKPDEDSITISLVAGALSSGRYSIVVLGIDKRGGTNEAGNGVFDLHLAD